MKMLSAYVTDPITSNKNMNGERPSAVPRLKFLISCGTRAPRYVAVIPHPNPCPIFTDLPALHASLLHTLYSKAAEVAVLLLCSRLA